MPATNVERLWSKKEITLMGILNLGADSFFDGNVYNSLELAVNRASEMIAQGVHIIDVGAASSKPGSVGISAEEELILLLPVIKEIRSKFPEILISIDTYQAQVAEACLNAGAHIINDISGGNMDAQMFDVIVKHNCPYILMHMQGTPLTMQEAPSYTDVVFEVYSEIEKKIESLRQRGFNKVIADVGFGFGKTLEHNYQLLYHLKQFQELGVPVLAGLSRKSMINKVLHTKAKDALNGTTALNTVALLNGANILRVHDVKEAAECAKLIDFYFQVNQ